MKTRFFVLAALLALTCPFISYAQIPRTLSYQGVLTDNAGNPRPDGSYSFTFRLYTSSTGGTAIWSESKSLPVKNGLFSTALGEQTPFGAAVKFDQQYWLGIQVGNEPELSPRMALTSVGYSFSSLRADTASVSVASLADTTWRHSGANIYRMNGNVGMGTSSPTEKLDIQGGKLRVGNTQIYDNEINRFDNDDLLIGYRNTANTILQANEGNVGIGTSHPTNKLEINIKNSGQSTDGITILNTNQSGYSGSLNLGLTSVAGAYLAAQITAENENNTSDDGGRLIFKTAAPNASHTMTERMRIDAYGRLKIGDTQINDNEINRYGVNNLYIQYRNAATNDFSAGNTIINGNGGNVGIGITSPSEKLDIQNGTLRVGGTQIRDNEINRYNNDNLYIGYRNTANTILQVDAGNVGIGTPNPTSKLHVEGTTTTKVLAITGGMDLAEPFEISESQPIPKGAVVIIDEENPGRLKLSHRVYDKRVAGVVSGAGGINPGLTLTQEGVLESGQNVALSGRVYALATAANGPIKPGDLLTTSDVTGHAMKATDFVRWQGAVIGKAMSSLEAGEGLVLVLVNLQ